MIVPHMGRRSVLSVLLYRPRHSGSRSRARGWFGVSSLPSRGPHRPGMPLGGHYGGSGGGSGGGRGAHGFAAMTLLDLLTASKDSITRVWPASRLIAGLKTSKATNKLLREARPWKNLRLTVRVGCSADEVCGPALPASAPPPLRVAQFACSTFNDLRLRSRCSCGKCTS